MREIKKIIIHCSATTPTQNIGVEEINSWHQKQGWNGIGYHFVIRRNGVIETGRELEKVGAHCKGQNKNSIGICLVGGIDKAGNSQNNFTSEQFNKLEVLLQELVEAFPLVETIAGHYDYANKDCPCFDVNAFLEEHGLDTFRIDK